MNRDQIEAIQAYQKQDYTLAAYKYRSLIAQLKVDVPALYFNLGQSYFKLQRQQQAMQAFERCLIKADTLLQSKALVKLGILYVEQAKLEQALDYFKKAVKKNPLHEDARYNYELLKKYLTQKKQQNQKPQPDNESSKSEESPQSEQQKRGANKTAVDDKGKTETTDKEGNGQAKSIQKKTPDEQGKKETETYDSKGAGQGRGTGQKAVQVDKEKLENLEMTAERANQILEAIKNQEIQYLQQKAKEAKSTKQDKNKSDW